MAMLQFGGVFNANVRITPRTSWWAMAQHLLHASSVATDLDSPVPADSPKDKRIENDEAKLEQKIPQKSLKSSKLNEPFDHYNEMIKNITKKNNPKKISQTSDILNHVINSAKNIDELLDVVNRYFIDSKIAYDIISILSKWVSSGEVKMSDIESDARYKKICSIINHDQILKSSLISIGSDLEITFAAQGIVQAEVAKNQIHKLNINEVISVLKILATTKKRSTPLLKALVNKLSSEKETLSIKQLGDILYSMAVLNFYNEDLMIKGAKDLQKVIDTNKNSAIIGSILTSLSFLRFKDEELLDELSLWFVKHQNKIRPQDITSLLLTLANVGYTPKNFSEVFEHIIQKLDEKDMCQSKEWLDIIWSLSILKQATSDHYKSVLNSEFMNRILDSSNLKPHSSKIIKLLNINAAAQSFMPEYKGPFIPKDSKFFNVPTIPSEKKSFSNSVISALNMLLPINSSYVNVNVNTRMGFFLDAEFCVDKNGTPVAVNAKPDNDEQVFRIGLVTCIYNEFCRGVHDVTGPVQFYKMLLEHQGYKVLLIPYTDVNVNDKIATRAEYIDNQIKILVESNSSK